MGIEYKVVYRFNNEMLEFGIVCERDGVSCGEFDGITTDREEIEKLARAMNEGSLAPSQFEDVVEDSII